MIGHAPAGGLAASPAIYGYEGGDLGRQAGDDQRSLITPNHRRLSTACPSHVAEPRQA